MAAIAQASPSLAPDDHSQEESKFQIYVQIAMLLAVITGLEIVAVYVPLARWIIFSSLVVLSVVKFMFVIFYFMHLRWDKLFCTILFFIGLGLAGGTVWALLLIHGVHDARPLTAGPEETAAVSK